jgi:hypothetical protein
MYDVRKVDGINVVKSCGQRKSNDDMHFLVN